MPTLDDVISKPLDEVIEGPPDGVGQVIACRVKSHDLLPGSLIEIELPGDVMPPPEAIDGLSRALRRTLAEVERTDVAVMVHSDGAGFRVWRGGNWRLVNDELRDGLRDIKAAIDLAPEGLLPDYFVNSVLKAGAKIEHARGIVLAAGGCAVTLDLAGDVDAMSPEVYLALTKLDALVTTDPESSLALATGLTRIRADGDEPAGWCARIAGVAEYDADPMKAVVALEERLHKVYEALGLAELEREHDLTVALGLVDTFRFRADQGKAEDIAKNAALAALSAVAEAKAKAPEGEES